MRKLIREALSQGVVDLYHFSNVSYDPKIGGYPKTLTLTPEKFSPLERKRSKVPRVFFYPDTPSHALRDSWQIRGGQLYKTTMPSSQIYDMTTDPDGFVAAAKNEYGFMDQDRVFNKIRERYPAAYMEGKFPVVVVFEPTQVELVDEHEKDMMMKKSA